MTESKFWIEKIDHISEAFSTLCSNLETSEINLKADDDEWSIAQIMEHLILTNSSYFPIFEDLKEGSYSAGLLSRLQWWPNFLGRFILKSVQPSNTKRIKTFPIWTPSKEPITDILNRFIQHQEILKLEIMQLEPYLEGAIIHSPANKHIVYPLRTALDIIVTHEERHLQQVKEILSTPNQDV